MAFSPEFRDEDLRRSSGRYTPPVEALTRPTDETLTIWDRIATQPGVLQRLLNWMMEENPDRKERKRLFDLAIKWGLVKKSDDNSRN